MGKSEPTLVPEWLKNSGSSTGGSTASHSDDRAASRIARNKTFMSSNGHDFGRSSSSDMATSPYFRRSSSINGAGNPRTYSSFGRNQRDKEWDKDTFESLDKGKLFLGDRRSRDSSDSIGNNLSSKFERDGMRRSQSLISSNRGETWHKKAEPDLSSAGGNKSDGFWTRSSPVGGVNKATFSRDFPSLGVEERTVVPEVGRIPSPGPTSAIQSLPIGSSAAIGGEKWTSALADVPLLVGSNGTPAQPTTPSNSVSVVVGTATGLNMAKTVAQGPSRAQTSPQVSTGTQRLEELAIKQSRQLIPVTPSMPRNLVVNTSDKQKTKVGLQHPISSSLPVSHSPRSLPAKADVSKVASNVGKLQVLKPVREKNGATPVAKDTTSPTNGSSVSTPMGALSATATVPSVSGSPATSRGHPSRPVIDRKPVLEKRPTSQSQSRNDFFNSVRKKSMANSSSAADSTLANSSTVLESDAAVSPSFPDKTAEAETMLAPDSPQLGDTPLSGSQSEDHLSEEKDDTTWDGEACDTQVSVQENAGIGKENAIADPMFPEEEETAFLRSLGWEENSDEGGLTEEEINSFFRDLSKYMNSKPCLKMLQGVRPEFLSQFESQIRGVGVSSGFSSSVAKLES